MAETQAASFSNIIDLTEDDDTDDTLQALSNAASKAQAAATRLTSQIDAWSPRPHVAQNDEIARSGHDARPTSHGVFQYLGNVADSMKKTCGKLSSPIQNPNASPDKNIQPGKSSTEQLKSTSHLKDDKIEGGNQIGEDISSQSFPAARSNVASIILNNDNFLPGTALPRRSPNLEFKRRHPSLSPVTGSPTKQTAKSGLSQPLDRQHHQEEISTEQQSSVSPNQVPFVTECDGQQGAPQGGQPWPVSKSNPNSQSTSAFSSSSPSHKADSFDLAESNQEAPAANASDTQRAPKCAEKTADDVLVATISDNIILPVIKEATRQYKDTSSADDLASVGQSVSMDVVEKQLKNFAPTSLSQLSNEQIIEIQTNTRNLFHKMVQDSCQSRRDSSVVDITSERLEDGVPAFTSSASPESSLNTSARNSTSRPAKIEDLSAYLKQLEDELSPGQRDAIDTISPVRPRESPQNSVAAASGLSQPILQGSNIRVDPVSSSTPNVSTGPSPMHASNTSALPTRPDFSTIPCFPSGFDRGRYPMMRRRRGNKYFTPERPSKAPKSSLTKVSENGLNSHGVLGSLGIKLERKSDLGSSQTPSLSVNQQLIDRVTADPSVRALLEVVASGKATRAQSEAFQALTQELSPPSGTGAMSDSLSQIGGSKHRTQVRRGTSLHANESGKFVSSELAEQEHDNQYPRLNYSSPSLRRLSVLNDVEPERYEGRRRHRGNVPMSKFDSLSTRPSIKFEASSVPDSSDFKHQNTRIPQQSEGSLLLEQQRANEQQQSLSSSTMPRQGEQVSRGFSMARDYQDPQVTGMFAPITRMKPFRQPQQNAQQQIAMQDPLQGNIRTTHDPRVEHAVAAAIGVRGSSNLAGGSIPPFITGALEESAQNKHQLFVADDTKLTSIEPVVVDESRRLHNATASLLRHRELGSNFRGRKIDIHYQLRINQAEKIKPWRYWKGASGDVVAVAWAPNSTTFAVGAAAHTNPEDVQYNRPCNLLLGDVNENTLVELPDHRIDRPKPETLSDSYNARQAVYDACDPMVYETVTSIGFGPVANRMYTASHDRTVKIWDVSATKKCLRTLHHDAKVTSVEVSSQIPGLFATASATIDNAIHLYYEEDMEESTDSELGSDTFSSARAQKYPDLKIYPECLRWGPNYHNRNLLLAGFRQWDHDDGEVPRQGHLCLWDLNKPGFLRVMPSAQSVLAAAWHPHRPYFATGGAPGKEVGDRKTRTVVRVYDVRAPNSVTSEYECRALDMQDVTFHPNDENIVTAGCTNGIAYVWDCRRPERPLHRLQHKAPLVDWNHNFSREAVDTGVMMTVWGMDGTLFYTGSSDGLVCAWDVRRNRKECLHSCVAQLGVGIQSGALSADGTNLLVGDADGGVHVLSSAPNGEQPEENIYASVSPQVPITLVRDPTGSGKCLNKDDDDPGTEGQAEAKRLIDTQQLTYDPNLGVTVGPKYNGRFAESHRQEAANADISSLPMNWNADNKYFFLRTEQENRQIESARRDFIAARKSQIAQVYRKSGSTQVEAGENAVTSHADVPQASTAASVQMSSSKKKRRMGDDGPIKDAKRTKISQVSSSEELDPISDSDGEDEGWWPDLGKLEIQEALGGK